jgi:hypothetical protein
MFFYIKGIAHKEAQTANSAYLCDVLRRVRGNAQRLRPELWRQKNWLLHRDNTLPLTSFCNREFFTKNNRLSSTTHLTFLFPRLKMKSKDRHFDTTDVIEAESQAVLNTFTEHNFQDALQKWQKRWER